MRLAKEMPDLDAAHALYMSPDKQTRSELETRLLAGMSTAAAAVACGLATSTVEAYGAVFFDITAPLAQDEEF